MKIIDCEQGSEEWFAAHIGHVSASCINRIIAPATGRISRPRSKADGPLADKCWGYIGTLCAEHCAGGAVDEVSSPWMSRGTGQEPEARKEYAFKNDVDVQQVGFIVNDDDTAGCSPDGLVGENGGLEIKCLKMDNHAVVVLRPKPFIAKHKPQVQASLWLAEREWWDLLSWSPLLNSHPIRCERDEEYIANMAEAVAEFMPHLHEAMVKLELRPKGNDDE